MDLNRVVLDESGIKWKKIKDNFENDVKELQQESEIRYISIVEKIVDSSVDHLLGQQKTKSKSRNTFQKFFIFLLTVQMFAVISLIVLSALYIIDVSDKVIITFIASIFVETLSLIGIMIKFNFDSSQEVQILQILHGVIKNFQKFHNS